MEIKPKKIGEKFFYRLLFTGKPVDGNRFSVNDRKLSPNIQPVCDAKGQKIM